jgi:methyl-accepting chemotaxis protein
MIDQSAMAGAAGFDAQRQMLEQTMGQIRQLGEAIKSLAPMVPMAADELQQIQQLLKQVVIKAASGAPQQTGSGMAVPGNGGGV